ncbi:hypothetical protein SOVF_097650 [Spinacia oleracea]|nr:hypothetical protein SOVF_097650 [Spinacia oleracea]
MEEGNDREAIRLERVDSPGCELEENEVSADSNEAASNNQKENGEVGVTASINLNVGEGIQDDERAVCITPLQCDPIPLPLQNVEIENNVVPPKVGMVFVGWLEVEAYYRSYGKQVGFGITRVKAAYKGGKSKEKRSTTWRCECSGKPDMRRVRNGKKISKGLEVGGVLPRITDSLVGVRAPRRSKKCDCPAMIYASVNSQGEWVIRTVVLEHKNHIPNPSLSNCISQNRQPGMTACKRRKFDRYTQFKEELKNVIYDCLTAEEFQSQWSRVIEEYHLQSSEWLTQMYGEREMWVPAYMKHLFCAGMRTTQRVENIHSFFDEYVGRHTRLSEFTGKYCVAMEQRASMERDADANTARYVRGLATGFKVEKIFQKMYTDAKFAEVQRECARVLYCTGRGETWVTETEVDHLMEDRVWVVCKSSKTEIPSTKRRLYRVRFNTETSEMEEAMQVVINMVRAMDINVNECLGKISMSSVGQCQTMNVLQTPPLTGTVKFAGDAEIRSAETGSGTDAARDPLFTKWNRTVQSTSITEKSAQNSEQLVSEASVLEHDDDVDDDEGRKRKFEVMKKKKLDVVYSPQVIQVQPSAMHGECQGQQQELMSPGGMRLMEEAGPASYFTRNIDQEELGKEDDNIEHNMEPRSTGVAEIGGEGGPAAYLTRNIAAKNDMLQWNRISWE